MAVDRDPKLADFLPKKLFGRLQTILLAGHKHPNGSKCFAAIVGNRTPEWQTRCYALLCELLVYWGKPGAICGVNSRMPEPYHLLLERAKKEGITLPKKWTYLDFPVNLPREERMALGLPNEVDRAPGPQATANIKRLRKKRIELVELLFAEVTDEPQINRATLEYRELNALVDRANPESKLATDYCRDPPEDLEDRQQLMIDLHLSHMNRDIMEMGLDYSDDEEDQEVKRLEEERKKKEEEEAKIKEAKRLEDLRIEQERLKKIKEKEEKEKREKEEQERLYVLQQEDNKAKKDKKKAAKSVRFKEEIEDGNGKPHDKDGIIYEVDERFEDTPSKARPDIHIEGISPIHMDEFDYSQEEGVEEFGFKLEESPQTLPDIEQMSLEELRELNLKLRRDNLMAKNKVLLDAFKSTPGLKANLKEIVQSQNSQMEYEIAKLSLEEEMHDLETLKLARDEIAAGAKALEDEVRACQARIEEEDCGDFASLESNVRELDTVVGQKKETKSRLSEALKANKENYQRFLDGNKNKTSLWNQSNPHKLVRDTGVFNKLVWKSDSPELKSQYPTAEQLLKKVNFSNFIATATEEAEQVKKPQDNLQPEIIKSFGKLSKFSAFNDQIVVIEKQTVPSEHLDDHTTVISQRNFLGVESAFGEQLSKLLSVTKTN